MKQNESFRKFKEICWDFSVFISVFLFNFWNYFQTFRTLKYEFDAEIFFMKFFSDFFELLGEFSGFQ